METWNRGEGRWWEEGEGTSQRTCMNDPWTWTVGAGGGAGRRRARGEKLGQL